MVLPTVKTGDPHAAAHNAERQAINELQESVIRGYGRPDGVINASIGAKYIDLDSTNGALEWIKESDVGSSGWRVSKGDTGWRKIVPVSTKLVGDFILRRTAEQIFIGSEGPSLNGVALDPGEILFNMPRGFLPAYGSPDNGTEYRPFHGVWGVEAEDMKHRVTVSLNGAFHVEAWGSSSATTGKLFFLWPPMYPYLGPEDVWPMMLPGAPLT